MASNKRDTSKARRAAQNRAARQARAARVERASAAPSDNGASRRSARAARASRSTPADRTARRAERRERMMAARAAQPPGYRAALTALLMSVTAVVFAFVLQAPVDANGDGYDRDTLIADWTATAIATDEANPGAEPADIETWTPGRSSEPYAIYLWPVSLALALPVVGAGIGFQAVRKRSASRAVNRALFATLLGALLSQIPFFFLPSVIAIGVATWQVRKVEMADLRAAAADAQQAGGDGGDGGDGGEVIDTTAAEDVPPPAEPIEGEVTEIEPPDRDDT